MIVSEAKGLPEQRRMCTRYLPSGSWCLFLDDDVTHINKPEHLNLHQLIMLGFLTAEQRHVHLWGLNVSARNLRDCYSAQLGLVCGYLFGIITTPELREVTPVSDTVGGAAESLERSLRYYVHSGLLRLNFASACAKTRTNAGGLQSHYQSSDHRQAAQSYVLAALERAFPQLIQVDLATPNGCKFKRGDAMRCEEDAEVVETVETVSSTEEPLSEDIVAITEVHGHKRAQLKCSLCGKTYARRNDLQHHMKQVHYLDTQERFPCVICSKSFVRKKDMLVHVRMKRCHSKRGKNHGIVAASKTADDGSPALDLGHIYSDVSLLGQQIND